MYGPGESSNLAAATDKAGTYAVRSRPRHVVPLRSLSAAV